MKPEVPAWTEDQFALLGDGQLSGDARVVGLLLSHAGEQGLSYSELEELLPDASRDRLRSAVQKLVRCKWADRLIGGRGRGDRFIYIACPPGAIYVAHRLAILGILKNRLGENGNLSGLSVPATGNLSALPPPITTPPPPPPLDARAREWVLSKESLEGCRGSLLDYLEARVSLDCQLAYAQTVAGIIEGTHENVWMARDGTHLREDRPSIVAGCLNELRQGDEKGKYFTASVGDVKNLETKIKYRVKATTDATNDAKRRANGRAATTATGTAGSQQGVGVGRPVTVER